MVVISNPAGPLSITDKVGQLFMIGFPGPSIPEETARLLNERNVGFVILFARNAESALQVAELSNHIHRLARQDPFIFTDQEGGTVVQFNEMAATVVSPMGLAATGDPGCARRAGELIAMDMQTLGIDGILAPVLDLNETPDNPIIGIRSFSDDPAMVIRFAGEFFDGADDHNIACCGKHFPGHGNTLQDSHLEIPTCGMTRRHMFSHSIPPFAELIKRKGLPAILAAHVAYPAFDSRMATFSPYWIQTQLRQKLGFEGLVLSDCLEMKAVRDNIPADEVVRGIMAAGVDVFTVSHELEYQKELMDLLTFYVRSGKIKESRIDESLARIIRFKNRFFTMSGRRQVNPGRVGQHLRKRYSSELEIARRSISVIRDTGGQIPVAKKGRWLVLEWEKVKASVLLTRAEPVSFLRNRAEKELDRVNFSLLKLHEPIPDQVLDHLGEYDIVLAGVYSRSPDVEQKQAEHVRRLLSIRPDLIVLAMGNPFDIRRFPESRVFIASYGFRAVQIEACFDILLGRHPAVGAYPLHLELTS